MSSKLTAQISVAALAASALMWFLDPIGRFMFGGTVFFIFIILWVMEKWPKKKEKEAPRHIPDPNWHPDLPEYYEPPPDTQFTSLTGKDPEERL